MRPSHEHAIRLHFGVDVESRTIKRSPRRHQTGLSQCLKPAAPARGFVR
jgi:hypothetical protein